MVLGRDEILSKMESNDIIIEPFSEENITPNGYDISISSEAYKMVSINRPVNPMNRSTLDSFLSKVKINGELVLKPFEPVSIPSKEKIGLSPSLMTELHGRSSLGQSGVFVHLNSGIIDSGFGYEKPQRVIFTLMSCNPNPVVIHPGQRVGQLLFHNVETSSGKSTPYSDYETDPIPNYHDLLSDLDAERSVIGITGLPGAGKSEVADICARLLNGKIYSMGEVVRKETENRGMKPTSKNIRNISIKLREEHGKDVIAKLLIDKLKKRDHGRPQIIEGIRSPDEIERLRDHFSDQLIMLGIHSPYDTRLKRIKSRKRSDDTPTSEFLSKRDQKEANFGVQEAITKSDYIITNDGSLSELEREVEKALARTL